MAHLDQGNSKREATLLHICPIVHVRLLVIFSLWVSLKSPHNLMGNLSDCDQLVDWSFNEKTPLIYIPLYSKRAKHSNKKWGIVLFTSHIRPSFRKNIKKKINRKRENTTNLGREWNVRTFLLGRWFIYPF